MIEFNHHKDRQENVVVTINSTLISGAGHPAIAPLLTGKKKLLLVSDGNVIKLAATQQILTLLQAKADWYRLLTTYRRNPASMMSPVFSPMRQTRHLIWSSVSAAAAFWMSANCYRYFITRALRALTPCWRGKADRTRTVFIDSGHRRDRLEATPNAILAIPEQNTKVGIISPVLLPDYVALLPELTTSMPAHIASSTGIDALCHLIECFTATIANPVSDNVALTGLRKLLHNIETAVSEPHNLTARLEMLWASYYGGAAITHAGPTWCMRSPIRWVALTTCRTVSPMPFCWPPA
jgi:hypothetical protein